MLEFKLYACALVSTIARALVLVQCMQCKQMLAQARTSTSVYTDWPTLLNYVQVWLSTPAVCPSTYLQTSVYQSVETKVECCDQLATWRSPASKSLKESSKKLVRQPGTKHESWKRAVMLQKLQLRPRKLCENRLRNYLRNVTI